MQSVEIFQKWVYNKIVEKFPYIHERKKRKKGRKIFTQRLDKQRRVCYNNIVKDTRAARKDAYAFFWEKEKGNDRARAFI